MPSFDITSEVNKMELKNAVDQANKEIQNRFDFKGSDARIEQTETALTVYADDDFKLKQVMDLFTGRCAKRGVDVRALDAKAIEKIGGNKVKQVVDVRNGIEQETSKRIVKLIKDSKLKVQASIQGDGGARVGGEEGRPAGGDPARQAVGHRDPAAVRELPGLARQPLDPPVVQPRRDAVQLAHPFLDPLLGLLGRLHRRARVSADLFAGVRVPRPDQVGGHLHVALHPEMPAERERLVGAIRDSPGSAWHRAGS